MTCLGLGGLSCLYCSPHSPLGRHLNGLGSWVDPSFLHYLLGWGWDESPHNGWLSLLKPSPREIMNLKRYIVSNMGCCATPKCVPLRWQGWWQYWFLSTALMSIHQPLVASEFKAMTRQQFSVKSSVMTHNFDILSLLVAQLWCSYAICSTMT